MDWPPSKWGTARICVKSWLMFSSALSTSVLGTVNSFSAVCLDAGAAGGRAGRRGGRRRARRRRRGRRRGVRSGGRLGLFQLENLVLAVVERMTRFHSMAFTVASPGTAA